MNTIKNDIMKKCSNFTKSQNIEILKFLLELNANISENADGSRIHLDKLSKANLKKLKRKIDEIDTPIDPKYQI